MKINFKSQCLDFTGKSSWCLACFRGLHSAHVKNCLHNPELTHKDLQCGFMTLKQPSEWIQLNVSLRLTNEGIKKPVILHNSLMSCPFPLLILSCYIVQASLCPGICNPPATISAVLGHQKKTLDFFFPKLTITIPVQLAELKDVERCCCISNCSWLIIRI
jgi:hypothetical protein